MEGGEERSRGNQFICNSSSAALRHTRVKFDDKQIPVGKTLVVKKMIDKN